VGGANSDSTRAQLENLPAEVIELIKEHTLKSLICIKLDARRKGVNLTKKGVNFKTFLNEFI
jgi:hypothetical protein